VVNSIFLYMTVQTKKFIEHSKEFVSIYEDLLAMDVNNKEISTGLGLHPSAFSSLVNKILYPIIKTYQSADKLIDLSVFFGSVNNISESKTRLKISDYIAQLREMEAHVLSDSLSKESAIFINELIGSTTKKIMDLIVGIYDVYYNSTFNYKVKREPFMIKYDTKRNIYIARKGNGLSQARYNGIAYLSNNQLLTIQLKELDKLIPDQFIIHFQLPPSYPSTFNLMKGLAISMSNAYLPIARKIVLSRLSSKVSMEEYEALETKFFSDQSHDSPIVRYIQEKNNLMEFYPIPHPTYSEADLEIESQIKSIVKIV
jgi:hypothetical protein